MLEAQVISEGQAAEDDGNKMPEMADELRVVILSMRKVRIPIDIGLPVHAPVRDPFDVAAVIGQADARFHTVAALGLVLADEAQSPVVPVQGFDIVIVLEIEVRDPDTPQDRSGHPVQPAPERFLDRRGRPDHLTMVGVIGHPVIRIQVHFPEIG